MCELDFIMAGECQGNDRGMAGKRHGNGMVCVNRPLLISAIEGLLKEKRRGKVTKGVLFLLDSALAHRVLATQNKLV
jgi:hypothetical protein